MKPLKTTILQASYYLKRLISYWKIIISFAILGALLGFSYVYFSKPKYIAICTFVLEEGERGAGGVLGQYSGLASMVGIDMNSGAGGIFQGDNIIELYKSRKMVQTALLSEVNNNGHRELLVDSYIQYKKLREKWKDKVYANVDFSIKNGQTFSRLQDSLLNTIVRDINKDILTVSKPDKKLSIIRVDVKSENELFAKMFNQQIVKTVNDFFVTTKVKKTLQNVLILQHQADSVKRVLNGAIYNSAIVNDATPNLNPTKQILRVPAQRFQLNSEANKAILTELVKNLELSKISLRKETPLIQIVDEPILPLEIQKPSLIISVLFFASLFTFFCILVLFIKMYLYD